MTLLWALVFFLVVSLSLVHASCKSQACPEAASFLFLPEFELAYGQFSLPPCGTLAAGFAMEPMVQIPAQNEPLNGSCFHLCAVMLSFLGMSIAAGQHHLDSTM